MKAKAKKPQVKVRDMKPRKDAKGGGYDVKNQKSVAGGTERRSIPIKLG